MSLSQPVDYFARQGFVDANKLKAQVIADLRSSFVLTEAEESAARARISKMPLDFVLGPKIIFALAREMQLKPGDPKQEMAVWTRYIQNVKLTDSSGWKIRDGLEKSILEAYYPINREVPSMIPR